MRIVVIGGGPAGLGFSILMRQQDRRHEITLFERNRPEDTFGWGVVFSDQTLSTSPAPTRRPRPRSPVRSRTGTTSTSTSMAG